MPIGYAVRKLQRLQTGALPFFLRFAKLYRFLPFRQLELLFPRLPPRFPHVFHGGKFLFRRLPAFFKHSPEMRLKRTFRLTFRHRFPVCHPVRDLRWSFAETAQMFLMFQIRYLRLRQLESASAEKSMILPAFRLIFVPCAIADFPEFRIAAAWSRNYFFRNKLLCNFRSRNRLPEKFCDSAEQIFGFLFLLLSMVLHRKAFPVLPHLPDCRPVGNKTLQSSRRAFQPLCNLLVREIRQNLRFLDTDFLRKRQKRIRRNLPIADQIMNACPFSGSPRKTPPQMLLVRTVK